MLESCNKLHVPVIGKIYTRKDIGQCETWRGSQEVEVCSSVLNMLAQGGTYVTIEGKLLKAEDCAALAIIGHLYQKGATDA